MLSRHSDGKGINIQFKRKENGKRRRRGRRKRKEKRKRKNSFQTALKSLTLLLSILPSGFALYP